MKLVLDALLAIGGCNGQGGYNTCSNEVAMTFMDAVSFRREHPK